MNRTTIPVILEYCGGARTDALYQQLSAWNPDYLIEVLDNASPHRRSRYITRQNSVNSGVGGGICDCVALAENLGATYVLVITNDIEPVTKIDFGALEALALRYPGIVQLGCATRADSDKSIRYPWMARHTRDTYRIVAHCDILCCLLRLDFLRSFNGFPPSKSGWGYDWEVAYQANRQGKQVVISDGHVIGHTQRPTFSLRRRRFKADMQKWEELKAIYSQRYENFEELFATTVEEVISRHSGVPALGGHDGKICSMAPAN